MGTTRQHDERVVVDTEHVSATLVVDTVVHCYIVGDGHCGHGSCGRTLVVDTVVHCYTVDTVMDTVHWYIVGGGHVTLHQCSWIGSSQCVHLKPHLEDIFHLSKFPLTQQAGSLFAANWKLYIIGKTSHATFETHAFYLFWFFDFSLVAQVSALVALSLGHWAEFRCWNIFKLVLSPTPVGFCENVYTGQSAG